MVRVRQSRDARIVVNLFHVPMRAVTKLEVLFDFWKKRQEICTATSFVGNICSLITRMRLIDKEQVVATGLVTYSLQSI